MKNLMGILVSLFASFAFAQEGATASASASKSTEGRSEVHLREVLQNKKFEDDRTLTDAKLRADAGSLSRYSLRASVSYYGPTLNDFGAKDQPNPDGSPGPYRTALGGSLGLRIRFSPTQTMSLSGGMKATYPFHGMERFDINDPSVSYDFSSRIGNLQMRNSPGFSVITVPEYTRVGETSALEYKNALVYGLGASGFALSFDTSFGYFFYNRGYEARDRRASRNNLGLSPGVKYNFTDKFNMNVSLNQSFYNPRESASPWIMWNRTLTQSIGFGYAIRRDIYISPYFRMYPTRLAADTTTFNLSTSLSVF